MQHSAAKYIQVSFSVTMAIPSSSNTLFSSTNYCKHYICYGIMAYFS